MEHDRKMNGAALLDINPKDWGFTVGPFVVSAPGTPNGGRPRAQTPNSIRVGICKGRIVYMCNASVHMLHVDSLALTPSALGPFYDGGPRALSPTSK